MWGDIWNRWQQIRDLQERQEFSLETLARRAFQVKDAVGAEAQKWGEQGMDGTAH